MAKEISLSANLAYSDANGVKTELGQPSLQQDVTTKVVHRGTQSIPTSDTAINKGAVSALGKYAIKNLDPTNFVTIKDAAAGKVIGVIKPGGDLMTGYAGSDFQNPVAIADTAACLIDVLLVSQ